MATKGASNRYGNSKGSRGSNKATESINYQWAKDFNKKTLTKHFDDHGESMSSDSKESYKQHAIRFANTIDKNNCESFVDKNGSTYKYNKKTNEFAIISKNGYVVTYYKPSGGYKYYKNQKAKYCKRRRGGKKK